MRGIFHHIEFTTWSLVCEIFDVSIGFFFFFFFIFFSFCRCFWLYFVLILDYRLGRLDNSVRRLGPFGSVSVHLLLPLVGFVGVNGSAVGVPFSCGFRLFLSALSTAVSQFLFVALSFGRFGKSMPSSRSFLPFVLSLW